jgi:hypothetical protein
MSDIYESLIKDFLNSIFIVLGRRTSLKFAEDSFSDAFKLLNDQFVLFQKMKRTQRVEGIYHEKFDIDFLSDISFVNKHEIASALESFIRIIYEDISEKSGLYFITEIKNHLHKDSIKMILDLGMNLERIQNEMHMRYASKKRKNELNKPEIKQNKLGYQWGSVSKWNYNSESKQVELFDNQGKVLDKIDLQQAIRYYVESLSGETEISSLDLENLLDEHVKSYSFLKLIHLDNVQIDTAKKMLNIDDDEILKIIQQLVELKFLKYVSDDEIELTEYGKEFMKKRKD